MLEREPEAGGRAARQREDPELIAYGRRAADLLGLAFEHRVTGYGELEVAVARLAAQAKVATAARSSEAAA